MTTKLTLSIDENILKNAKNYLKDDTVSLSKLVEEYFRLLVAIRLTNKKETPIVEAITGLAKQTGTNSGDQIREYLNEKYK
ncbi:hypothetical protein A2382_01860 [Candidatus Woesebacteria bacterium RIFOXYB1_FULL_38_16]|uniref:Antitoxin n=1 Tax=Candidatus Woesebacteria bacterium RIFOXYB1_FULL_38_16 TaxID=1802538 RepID=A0A1F8CTI4_9BACT|nr:MAG: hypothetical protein A2191_02665 [Candidatus Woesebacteria bacterium RIFOXYA1_FULL_38_9]OGM79647.1 MAG: hypothetical protein A2382_01860 [Candidatus Woesebacteria bacterium RIFOXYB1_FULL_38_16]